jgi:hypothetical protein
MALPSHPDGCGSHSTRLTHRRCAGIAHILAAEDHRSSCRRMTRSSAILRPRNEPTRRAGSDSAGGRAFRMGIGRCCCRGSASAMAPAGAFGFGRRGSRTPAGGGQLPPRLPKRPPPKPRELRPPTWSMTHRSGAVRAIRTGFAMITRARLCRHQTARGRRGDLRPPRPARALPATGRPRRAVRRRTPRRRANRDSRTPECGRTGGRLSRGR